MAVPLSNSHSGFKILVLVLGNSSHYYMFDGMVTGTRTKDALRCEINNVLYTRHLILRERIYYERTTVPFVSINERSSVITPASSKSLINICRQFIQ